MSERAWWQRLPADAALNLAVFRITVGVLLLTTPEVRSASAWTALPEAMASAPPGWGWALAMFPPSPAAARAAGAALTVGAALGIVGLFSRAAFACATLAGLFVLALPLRSGLPFHYQHLIWFAALCAASPSGDALSIDAWLRRRRAPRGLPPPPARSPAYGVPIRAAWLLLGIVFFFPGLWKLRAAGLAWITSDNLRNQMYWKWLTVPGLSPPLRVDRLPGLLHVAAAGVVLLELTFGVAVWRRSLRPFAVGAALLFHAFARLFMGIDFSGLWLTYVVFVDWDALLARWRRRRRRPAPAPAPDAGVEERVPLARVAPAIAVAVVLVLGAAQAGARGLTTGWPFACYPTFQDLADSEMPALAVALVAPDGNESTVEPQALVAADDRPHERALGLRLLAAADRPGAAARFDAYWSRIAAHPEVRGRLRGARAVRFYVARFSIVPEQRDRPARRLRLLYEAPLPPPS